MKKKLSKQVWSESGYYKIAEKGSLDVNHPGMVKLAELAKTATNILDMGCGEGTRLNNIIKRGKKGYGIDISKKAVEIAKKKYPHIDYKVGNLEKLPYKNRFFDLVYSAFVFEHLDNPEKVIMEGMRVLKKGGRFLIVAPNFGAPNRASPPFKGNRIGKLVKGILKDFLPGKSLSWQKVRPIATAGHYEIDWDTTIEPYLGSLNRHFRNKGCKILYFSSCWGQDSPEAGNMQKMFKLLGRAGIYPFSLWGPHLVLVAEKK